MIVVTTNATIRGDGALVMGSGAALQATRKIEGIEFEAGRKTQEAIEESRNPRQRRYGFLVVRPPSENKIGLGLFQVKYAFNLPALVPLIHFSVNILASYAQLYPEVNIRMNYPGIGNGQLPRWLVEPHLQILPNNVTVCYQ